LLFVTADKEMSETKTTSEADMNLTYDIFRRFSNDGPIWIETVHGLDTCKSRLLDLVQHNPGDYFAFDPLHSRVVASSSDHALLSVSL
jgi:hypothetical protein